MNDFNSHPLFETFKAQLNGKYKCNINIIDIMAGVLYVWVEKESIILTLNLESQIKHSKTYDLQTLYPTHPPVFVVERLQVNKTNTQCAIVGPMGINILKIPRRWGADGMFEGGKNQITCSCDALDDRYFMCRTTPVVKQTRWHPGSVDFSQLLVLTAENTFRLYSTTTGTLLNVWNLDSSDQFLNKTGSRLQTLALLGDVAIDFDFGPPQLKKLEKASEMNVIEFPIFILKGNGDVYIVRPNMESQHKYSMHGPLQFTPQSDDNYGLEDACSIIVLRCGPPIVVIASSSGMIYHALLFTAVDGDEDPSSIPDSTEQWLHIFECVELELGLTFNDTVEQNACQITLLKDPHISSHYLCSHDAGLHVVNVPMVNSLLQFAACPEADSRKHVPSFKQLQSSVEYVICTRFNDSVDLSDKCSFLGLAVVESPATIIAILSNGEVMKIPISIANDKIVKKMIEDKSTTPDDIESQANNFELHIRNGLKPPGSTSRPLLKLNSDAQIPPEKCLKILDQETDELRYEYIGRFYDTVKEVEKRRKLLDGIHRRDVEDWLEFKRKLGMVEEWFEEFQNTLEIVSRNLIDLRDRSKKLSKKVSGTLSSDSHNKLVQRIREQDGVIKNLTTQLDELFLKYEYQQSQMMEINRIATEDAVSVSDLHAKTVTNAIEQMNDRIKLLKLRMCEINGSLKRLTSARQ